MFCQGLIYLDVLIDDKDQAVVPPLEGFVMNRITEDNFEKLLYKGKSQYQNISKQKSQFYAKSIVEFVKLLLILRLVGSVRIAGRAQHGVRHGDPAGDRPEPGEGRGVALLQTGLRKEEDEWTGGRGVAQLLAHPASPAQDQVQLCGQSVQ